MAVYSVHLPGAPGQKPNASDAAFVREGFCWPAFVFGPFWLLGCRLWLSAALWFAAFFILSGLAGAGLLSTGASLMLMLLLISTRRPSGVRATGRPRHLRSTSI